jgi:HEAT repeat protein
MSTRANTSVPDLVKALKDDDWQVRNQAAMSLGLMGPEAKAAVPSLIDVLQGDDKIHPQSCSQSSWANWSGGQGRDPGTDQSP